MTEANKAKRTERAKQTAEVFTPPRLVKQMLDKLPKEVWRKGKTFLDPACGSGNFLIAVLWRKIERNHNPLEALSTIYGVDIMRDNVQECRLRLLKLVSLYEPLTEDHVKVVWTNIVYINVDKHEGGSLDYDFAFRPKFRQEDIDRWMEWIKNGKLAEVGLPVQEAYIEPAEGQCFEDEDSE